MKVSLFLIIFILLSVFLCSETNIYYGPVSGTWTAAESPFLIHAEINIPTNQTLTIEPGVIVSFQGHYKFIIYGRLLAEGTVNDSILFTAENEITGWKGLRFTNTNYNGLGLSRIEYCKFNHGITESGTNPNNKGGALICLNSSNLLIQNSVFTNNKSSYGGAIALSNSSPTFYDLIIEDNYASHDGGGIFIAYNSNPNIENTLITHNSCFFDGGGVFISGNSNPTLENCTISQNEAGHEYDCGGAGAVVWGAQATFDGCLITENIAYERAGGLWIRNNSQVELNNCIITRNQASSGGGIRCDSSDLSLSGTSIFRNIASYSRGGLQCYNVNLLFDQNNRSSIYSNIALNNSDCGIDIYNGSQDIIDVYLDTFTVAVPTEVYAYPLANFTFDIQNHIYQPEASDLYVSATGSHTNSGLTPSEPIKSISQAMQMVQPDSLNHLTIYIEDGVYSPLLTDEVFPIQLKAYLTLQGTSKWNTIIDAEDSGGIFRLVEISEVNLNDLSIKGGEEDSYSYAGGISCNWADINLNNMTIMDCHASNKAGGVSISGDCNLNLSGTSIYRNSSNGNAGAIDCDYGSPIINFDPVNLCNIYLNDSSDGYEIYWYESPIHVIVDTFTIINPDETIVFPFTYFTFDINNAIYEPVAADLYVSPTGSDENNGLTPDEPLKTIHRALRMIITTENDPHTIYLADGVYSPSTNGENFPVTVEDYITISGVSRENTILDAEQTDQVLRILGNHANIENISVINGYSSFGAGIYIQGEQTHLQNMIVKDNSAISQYYNNAGGGIYCYGGDTILEDMIICDNVATHHGGGIYLGLPGYLSGVTIKNNIAISQQGGGIFCDYQATVFDSLNLCNIMNNHSYSSPSFGNDIYFIYDSYFPEEMHVFVDTFTVQYPSNYYANPIEHITFNIQNYYLPTIETDVYVSPNGSNSNSGLTADDPFRSITYALQRVYADSLNPRIINLAPGIYSPAINGELFPLGGDSYITIQGESKENTYIDGNDEGRFIFCQYITDFTINDCSIRNCNMSDPYYSTFGGAVFAEYSKINLNRVNIHQNISYMGGAIYSEQSDISISDSYIYYNSANYGGAIYSRNSDLTLLNNTICFNEASSGGAVYYRTSNSLGENQQAILTNQILWDNQADQIYLRGTSSYTATMVVSHSDIQEGQTGIQYTGNYSLHWLEGNIDANPLFGEVENEFFMLQPESPCIDTGTAYFEWEDQVYLDMQPEEYFGLAPDIGAWESEFTGADIPQIPLTFALQQNFPNPFNPDTIIQFSVPVKCKVELAIYNIKGQKVKQLVEDHFIAGKHTVVWSGKDNSRKSVSSGIYFYKIKAKVNGKNRFIKVKKMMMLK